MWKREGASRRTKSSRGIGEARIHTGALKCLANQFATACPRGDKYQADSDINARAQGASPVDARHERIGPLTSIARTRSKNEGK